MTRELPVHASILGYLRQVLPHCVTAHIPNGGARDARTGAMLKRLGTLAGMPDLVVILPRGRVLWLEVKGSKGRTSTAQTDIWLKLRGLNHDYAVVHSIDETRRALAALAIETREA